MLYSRIVFFFAAIDHIFALPSFKFPCACTTFSHLIVLCNTEWNNFLIGAIQLGHVPNVQLSHEPNIMQHNWGETLNDAITPPELNIH